MPGAGSNFTAFFKKIIILIDPRVFRWPRRDGKELGNVTNLRTVHREGLNKNEVIGEKARGGFPAEAIGRALDRTSDTGLMYVHSKERLLDLADLLKTPTYTYPSHSIPVQTGPGPYL